MDAMNRELGENARRILDEFLKECSSDDYTLDVCVATSAGENFSSTIFRVTVTSSGSAAAARSLIVKVLPDNKNLRLVFPMRAMCEQEAFYYQQVFPELERLQVENAIANPFVSYPKLLKAHLEDCKEVFILEDLKESGYRLRSRMEPLDYDHSLLVIKEYAKLHGASYALKKLKPEVFQRLSASGQEKIFAGLGLTELREKHLQERTLKALESLDPVEHKHAYDRFLKFSKTMFYAVQDAVATRSAGDYAVFTHSDSWICNYLFKYQNGVPVDLRLLDWQLAHCGSPALDLSFFFFCCTDQDLRKKHYEHLLHVYYDTLSLFLQQFHCDVKQMLPFDVLKEHLGKFSKYGMYMATIVLNMCLLQGGNMPSLPNASSESDYLQLRDVKDRQDLELYNSRMRGAILDFIDYGYDGDAQD